MKIKENLKKKELPNAPVNPLLGLYPKEFKEDIKYLHSHVPCSIIYNSQEVETTEMFTDEWVGKNNVV